MGSIARREQKVRDQTKQAKNSKINSFMLYVTGFFRSYFLNCQCNSRFQKTLIYWLDPIQKSPLDPDNNLNYYFWPEKTLSSKWKIQWNEFIIYTSAFSRTNVSLSNTSHMKHKFKYQKYSSLQFKCRFLRLKITSINKKPKPLALLKNGL